MVQLLKINNPGLVFFSVFLSVCIHILAAIFPADFHFLSSYTEPLITSHFPEYCEHGIDWILPAVVHGLYSSNSSGFFSR
jgi:hypothetical protein